MLHKILKCSLATILAASLPALGQRISWNPEANRPDLWLRKTIELPPGKILRAWTTVAADHEFVLYVNGREAGRSLYGRVASGFRLREELLNLADSLQAGPNLLAARVHRWSPGPANFRFEGEVQIEAGGELKRFHVLSDATWRGSDREWEGWNRPQFDDTPWSPAALVADREPNLRIGKNLREHLTPRMPPPLHQSVLEKFPDIADMSDWGQEVIFRDPKTVRQRLMEEYQTAFVAERMLGPLCNPNTRMGDSFSINGISIGNGMVWTSMGSYPFTDTNYILGPEYQMPVQWQPGSTFPGTAVRLLVDGKDAGLRDQWIWKIRKTDVVVSIASSLESDLAFITITFTPLGLPALLRIYAVTNRGGEPARNAVLIHTMARTKVEGDHLVGEVKHSPVEAGDSNTRRLMAGFLLDEEEQAKREMDEPGITFSTDEKQQISTIKADLGAIPAGECKTQLFYAITYLTERNGQPVESKPQEIRAEIQAQSAALLKETIQWWRTYVDSTPTLDAPGPWGKRVADLLDDEKILVQTQQFEKTGAAGPMSFFSDQWIRDACGPVKAFLRTGKFEKARRVLDYHYLSSIACRKILNWLPMDVDIQREWPAVEDWSQITVNYADRHANCEVPSWLILQHYWYYRFTGDIEFIRQHWGYLMRCLYGQFDNAADKIFRPDFKFFFHGDETYIYSGGESLWENRYDLLQSSYVHGLMYSADSSFEFVAAADALCEMAQAMGAGEDFARLRDVAQTARAKTEQYYWLDGAGMYAPGMSRLFDDQPQTFPMANINANVIWCGYLPPADPKAESNALRMMEYLIEDSGVLNPIVGYDNTVGMLQGQGLYSAAAINHPWAEKAFYALLMITGDTGEYTEWMMTGHDYQTLYRANRMRPWEGGINLDAMLYYLTGLEPDAPKSRLVLTPRMPTGRYSPIRWDRMTVKNLTLGKARFDLSVLDQMKEQSIQREYTVTSHAGSDFQLDLTVVLPFGEIRAMESDGRALAVESRQKWNQDVAAVSLPLAANSIRKLRVSARRTPDAPVQMELKPFEPPRTRFGKSDVVIFTHQQSSEQKPALWQELRKQFDVVCIDSSLPASAVQFGEALLEGKDRKTHLLILDEASMGFNRKPGFWESSGFEKTIGKFLNAGGVVIESNSGNSSSRWLANLLGKSRFEVDGKRQGQVLALDASDEKLDLEHHWLDELQAEGNGKWSGYWAGYWELCYIKGGPKIMDRVLMWGEQEQPHGSMQYNFKTAPGKDHLVRVRTYPSPKKGFTLLVQVGEEWREIETVWVPQDIPDCGGWVDVSMKMPADVVKGEKTTFRLKAPAGSYAGIGVDGRASTGAARVWIRDGLTIPGGAPDTRSALAAALGLPDKGVIGNANAVISFEGFASPYRILGDSRSAALILKPVGDGFYVVSTLRIETAFGAPQVISMIQTLLEPAKRKAAASLLRRNDSQEIRE